VIAAVPVELADDALAADVVDGLARVEDGLQQALKSQHPVLAASSAHLMEAGGKRLRPMLVLLSA
jgi:heptaprenyl diphosphate synthase